ncbi:HNH endonuclease [Macleaya cordata]|uniref:HNH endonuclease n=1 Tax=Macleaya cordata TaxID=56857 RepID=A0A200R160_MACCD|nr:HNH endonuclease [Macleaya cordata]
MAQFTAQGRLKPLLNGDRVLSFGFETKDPFQGKVGLGVRFMDTHQIHFHKKKIRYNGSSRIFSSLGKKSSSSNAEERLGVGNDGEDIDEVCDFETDELSSFRGLVLDISYRPVNVICWRRAICLEFMEKADVLEYYDQTVNSPSGSFYIPAVLRVPHLLQVVKRRKIKQNLSRKNILFRDVFTCQYCSSRESLTIDHVLPISRGGEWKWENLVTACARCNSRKGQKTVEEANMKLIKVPKAPKDYDILAIPLTTAAIKMLRTRKGMPNEWRQYLSKPPLEP